MNTFSEYYAFIITVSMIKVKNSGQQPGAGPWSGLDRFLFSFTFFVMDIGAEIRDSSEGPSEGS